MGIDELDEYLRQQGVEVRYLLHQRTHRPGQPDVVTPVGLELGNDLAVYVYGDGSMVLSWWPDDDSWEEIGEFAPTEVDELLEAIREHTL
jgi:hypothetical protein